MTIAVNAGNISRESQAARAATDLSTSDWLQLITFQVSGEEFGIEIVHVQEILRMQRLTRVPKSPAHVAGVINVRGKLIPVVNLRQRFGLVDAAATNATRIVVIDFKTMILGLIVDSVSEVLRISAAAVVPAPGLGREQRDYVAGIAKLDSRLIIVLDLERLTSVPGQGKKDSPGA